MVNTYLDRLSSDAVSFVQRPPPVSTVLRLAQSLAERTANHAHARGFPEGRLPTAARLLAAAGEAARFPTPVFDPAFYLSHLPPGLRRETCSLRHYLECGAAARIPPHACVDLNFFATEMVRTSGDVCAEPALLEIVAGTAPPFASPNPLFEPDVYAANLPARALDGLSPFEHFLLYWQEYRVPFSRFFDHEFYMLQNRHVAAARMNPLCHYFSLPVSQRMDANPMVHGRYYAATVAGLRGDPLAHYVRFGLDHGAAPNPYAFAELRVDRTQLPAEEMRVRLIGYVARA